MFMMYALALLRGVPVHLCRFGRACEHVADELLADAPAFWRRHRGRVLILVVSASVSGVLGYVGERLNGPL